MCFKSCSIGLDLNLVSIYCLRFYMLYDTVIFFTCLDLPLEFSHFMLNSLNSYLNLFASYCAI
jgi:hypothetical protein